MMHRASSRVLLIVAAFVLFLVPVAAIAAGGFTDVDDDSVFKTDIAWLADAGVTKGCNPPTNDKFCPGGNVTREQMAAFMHRLAVNKIVDAKTALTAGDADLLDGMDSTAFATSGHNHDTDYLAKTGKAADADKLDGKDSTAFLSAASLRPVAMALLEPETGYINVATGTGFSKVVRAKTGIYCFALDPALGIDRSDVMVNVSVEYGNSSGNGLFAYWFDAGTSCGSDLIEIRTYRSDTLTLTDNVGFVVTAFTGPYTAIPTG